jgi:hypothetical protein
MSAHVDNSLISAARVAEAARPELDRLSDTLGCTAAAIIQIGPMDQMIGASSYAGGRTVEERIGVRLPLLPPLGEVSVAWDDEQLNLWARRIHPYDEGLVEHFVSAARRTRERGYGLVTEVAGADYNDLLRALDEYADGNLTPVRDRAVKSAFLASRPFFGSSISSDDSELTIISLSVPVFDPWSAGKRNSGLVLRLSDLPRSVDGATVKGWVSMLQKAAVGVSSVLGTTARRDYARYVASDFRSP